MLDTALTPEFLSNVANHKLSIERDDGLYRHLRFRKTDAEGRTSYNRGFDIVTWPGWLAYSGDMGSFMFTRVPDMLRFFRRGEQDRRHGIDMRYWAEKCEAEGTRGDGLREFDPDAFKREITVQRRRLLVEHGRAMSQEQREDLWRELGDLRDAAEEDQSAAFVAVRNFSFCVSYDEPRLYLDTDDFPRCERYTHRFEWCCQALAWGIAQYDAARTATLPNTEAALHAA